MANDAGFPSWSHESKNGSLTVALAGIWGINVTSFVQIKRDSSMSQAVSRRSGGRAVLLSRGTVQNTLFNVSEEGTS